MLHHVRFLSTSIMKKWQGVMFQVYLQDYFLFDFLIYLL